MSKTEIAPSTLPPGSGASLSATKHGGLVRIAPQTRFAEKWLHACAGKEAVWLNGALVIRLRNFSVFADAAIEAGFTFERDALPN